MDRAWLCRNAPLLLLFTLLVSCDALRTTNAVESSFDGEFAGGSARAEKIVRGAKSEVTYDTIPDSPLTFKGYVCTLDYSRHEAGYEWARVPEIDDAVE
jgi:hypothetical protein